jgi:hypothetical protein
MLNHPFFHPDPPVAGNPDQAENPDDGATEDASPTVYELGGEKYTEEQLTAALSGQEQLEAMRRDNDAAYTRQTQDVAEKRREVEEMEARAKALLSQAEQEFAPADPLDETIPGLGKKFQSIEQKLEQLTRTQQEEAAVRAESEAAEQRSQALDAAINSLDGRPLINDKTKAEIRREMELGGYAPQHVGTIYNARFAAQIGEQRGFQRAVRAGAQAGPPQMGAGETGISPGFTTPSEAPGVDVDVSQQSWNDVKEQAMADQNKNFGS